MIDAQVCHHFSVLSPVFEGIDGPLGLSAANPLFRTQHGGRLVDGPSGPGTCP